MVCGLRMTKPLIATAVCHAQSNDSISCICRLQGLLFSTELFIHSIVALLAHVDQLPEDYSTLCWRIDLSVVVLLFTKQQLTTLGVYNNIGPLTWVSRCRKTMIGLNCWHGIMVVIGSRKVSTLDLHVYPAWSDNKGVHIFFLGYLTNLNQNYELFPLQELFIEILNSKWRTKNYIWLLKNVSLRKAVMSKSKGTFREDL